VTRGQIITFYSYKGGTGRTMSVANTACLLARRLSNNATDQAKISVVAIDWDFEAPGLHRYFIPYIPAQARREFDQRPGCIDLLQQISDRHTEFGTDSFRNRSVAKALLESIDFESYLQRTTIPGLAILKAGRFDADYAKLVNTFDWEKFFYSTEGFFAGFADFMREAYEYVLLDSRTGVTDTSGICTALLPDKLVVPFTPNAQSLSGLQDVVRRAVTYRRNSEDWRPLSVFPLPSRVDISRPVLAEQWRNSPNGNKATDASAFDRDPLGYEPVFVRLFEELYGPESSSLSKYFDEVVLQHVPDYAFGEPIAVELETTDSRIFLRRSYENFVDRLIELSRPWESLEETRRSRELAALIDEARTKATSPIDPKDQAAAEEAIRLGFRLVEAQPSISNVENLVSAVLAIAALAIKSNPSSASLLATAALQQTERFAEEDWQIQEAALREVCALFDSAAIVGEAERYRWRHVALLEKELGVENPATVSAMQRLASTLKSAGKFSEARTFQERVVELRRRLLGSEHLKTRESVKLLASISPEAPKPVQIYISYARDDNSTPPGSENTKGFVEFLDESLRYEMRDYGEPRPVFWRDTKMLGLGDSFEEATSDAIARSDIFLIILSRNWVASRYCRRELESFLRRMRQIVGTSNSLGQRIMLAELTRIPPEQLPSVLRGHAFRTFPFFSLDSVSEEERRFFARGKVQDDRYWEIINALAKSLRRTAERLVSSPDRELSASPSRPSATIYLAKPAGDMRRAYERLAKELLDRGYQVVPAIESEIPADSSAETFVDEMLAQASCSIHLLGERSGFAPEDSEPIVRLQLARSFLRRQRGRGFRRIIWAPERWDAEGNSPVITRNPVTVFAIFGRMDPGDLVDGSDLNSFIDSLSDLLPNSPTPDSAQPLP
jgi:MinD-like ATPase involved in chromosome partitioning or flagellar assembly